MYLLHPARLLVATLLCLSLAPLVAQEVTDATRAKDSRRVKALLRLENVDLETLPEAKASLMRHLETIHGTDEFLELVRRFKLKAANPELIRLAIEKGDETIGVEAVKTLFDFGANDAIEKELNGKDDARAVKLAAAMGLAGDPRGNELLLSVIGNSERSVPVRSAAVTAIGRNKAGQEQLLKLVEAGTLAKELNFAAANVLLSSTDAAIKTAAGKHLTLPATADSKPLPTVAELVKRTGDVAAGKQVFGTIGTCIKCHKVRGEGKDVGPDLSEIGSKLSKEAFYVSILDPSAGISHNFETYTLLLADGTVQNGILVSQTDADIQIKTADAIVKQFPRDEVEDFKKSTVSLMPADLQKALTAQNLVDVVEYLTTLKKQN
ncbi:Cytochrome c [Anatilimnocola aggregata]|uniref:Cytochrome c n=1 Tax=Anatilimnocola aggregata TaxID=2528021 RepID=A0A517YGL4_9BACT|nr:c-type cytochrome [Anatilimnocola aggregata]QDU29342.1 Cytochrome c [Anatilimnocola aggregata]